MMGLALGSCARATNLLSPAGPRFEGKYASPSPAAAPDSTIRVVTFNIRFAREIERAIEVLHGDSLRSADILALQEMDEVAVERIARTLGYDYAFYPAVIHPTSGRYFGPAILSRWPIERSWKVLLPHAGWTRGQRRTATAAVVRIGDCPVLAYAVHLETPVQVGDGARRDQAMAVLEDAAEWRGPVVIAGDFNSQAIGPLLVREGYLWLTRWVGPTVAWFSWDHVFVRRLTAATPRSAGVVHEVRGASDHRPVWAVAAIAGGAAPGQPAPRAAR
ncbi:MAG TPA: endonuclease/exonuclease/phosphatase family protein [Gemmatimonadales bacterium]|jgi:endonuclease/exonuclease/phosphatase family metal-dependent hydrolase